MASLLVRKQYKDQVWHEVIHASPEINFRTNFSRAYKAHGRRSGEDNRTGREGFQKHNLENQEELSIAVLESPKVQEF